MDGLQFLTQWCPKEFGSSIDFSRDFSLPGFHLISSRRFVPAIRMPNQQLQRLLRGFPFFLLRQVHA